ncbi:aminopeptidase N [Nocardioides marmoribigeumensis]|uniref:Aminopeptidase N n=1 Tax=Nocardioides marmoribigeumensis TaxID=433649 RepID=A0ABU2C0N0_9ACTN|nr:aminopeptidase N [Nocardioides marmoribigeumensis]MDR7364201.1 aminopeptidase N [Nocardioides marmoribigeumensis]
MPGTNLTRDEAATRSDLITVDSYDVTLDLTTGNTTFASTTVVRFSCRRPGTSTFADLVGATVHSIDLNGRPLDPADVYADSRIALDDLAEDNVLTVVADCRYSRVGEGLHRFVDPADDRVYTYTQFEVPDARRVYTTFEQPDLKSVFTFTVTAPADWVVVSNAATPEPEPAEDGAAVWRFPQTERMSTYITAIVAGEYHATYDVYEGPHGKIPLGHLCRQSMKDHLDVDELLTITKQGFEFFEKAFEFPYPFGKYDQAYVPEYNMGAMENAGCVTLRDDYLPRSRQTAAFYDQRANTVLHEMAHMWFGDLVTMRWWDDLWLNESFAEWAAHHSATRATKYTEAWTGFTNARKNWAYRQDQLPTTHPVAADNHDLEAVEVNFDGITYAKGASVLKQLVAWVGEAEFLQGLRSYFQQHAFGNSEFTDLLSALESSSGRELSGWAHEWLRTSGVNTLAPEFDVDASGRFTTFAVRQTSTVEHPELRRHRIGIGLYDLRDGHLVRRSHTETDVAGSLSDVPDLVGQERPDLLLLNDGDLTYAKIRLDERSLETLVEHIDELDDSLARALCWGAAWDMTRDAEMAARDFAALVLRGVASETDLVAVGALLRYATQAVDQYTAPATRAEIREAWERGLRRLVEEAAPGSDHQLALVRSLAGNARAEESLDRVQGLYDNSAPLEGLEVSTDLRWVLLTSLAAGGRANDTMIDAMLEQDRTISGKERAAAARAVQPTAEAKSRAWHDAVERDDVPNETQRSIAGAFQVAGQEDVLEPFQARYLEMAETVWERKGSNGAQVMLTLLFPRTAPDPELLERVEAWIAGTHANPGSVRYVREGADDLRRALANQARDAELD